MQYPVIQTIKLSLKNRVKGMMSFAKNNETPMPFHGLVCISRNHSAAHKNITLCLHKVIAHIDTVTSF